MSKAGDYLLELTRDEDVEGTLEVLIDYHRASTVAIFAFASGAKGVQPADLQAIKDLLDDCTNDNYIKNMAYILGVKYES